MPRKIIPQNPFVPYHVTARSVNREAFPIPMDSMWSLFGDYLFLTRQIYEIRIHSFVLMPNHFHMIVTFPNANIGESMRYFMRESSREISRLSGRINQSYGSRHFKSLIGSYHYFMNAYKYVYRNPVRSGLSVRVEQYKYSTLSGLLGVVPMIMPVVEDTLLFPDSFDDRALRWLNTKPMGDCEEEVRRALKHSEFKLARKGRVESPLETQLL